MESRVAIVLTVSWLHQGRPWEMVNAHIVVTLDPITKQIKVSDC